MKTGVNDHLKNGRMRVEAMNMGRSSKIQLGSFNDSLIHLGMIPRWWMLQPVSMMDTTTTIFNYQWTKIRYQWGRVNFCGI
jgi:myo-inositol catabolism protein IolC